MSYSVFSPRPPEDFRNQPMFFGQPVNVARYERQKYEEFEDYSEKQIGFFWRPHEVILTQDRVDFLGFDRHERHIYVSNLEYQILMDSVQGRAPLSVLAPIVSLPELEHWLVNWTFSENIHSRSYTHMIRGIMNDPSASFDSIMGKEEIRQRARDVARYYDDLHAYNIRKEALEFWPGLRTFDGEDPEGRHAGYISDLEYDRREHMRAVVMCLYSVNALEAIRFYASFACTFLFKESTKRMGGSATIMQFIARDESLHHSSTNMILYHLGNGDEGDEWARMVEECKPAATALFMEVVQQEWDWCDYLFQYGSMLGMNADVLKTYVRETAYKRMTAIDLKPPFDPVEFETLPWMSNYLSSGHVQGTPQEKENKDYLIGAVNNDIDPAFLEGLDF